MLFLLYFTAKHEDFRRPELESLAVLEGLDLKFVEEETTSAFEIIELKGEDEARRLVKRSCLVRNISSLWADSETLELLHEKLRMNRHLFEKYLNSTFKISVSAYQHSMKADERVDRINSFSWMALKGAIDLKNPEVEFGYFEEFSYSDRHGKPIRVFFGQLLAIGDSRLANTYNLKKREYLGTTSMESLLSLVTANQALARPGSLILDPFVGTGSFLVSCSHYGAYTLGSDIDGRKLRGSEQDGGINANLKQYKLESLVLGGLTMDIAHHCWRKGPLFDAIVCDVPYGVREGARKIWSSGNDPTIKGAAYRYPKTEKYEMSQIVIDLIVFAVDHLAIGGRLVFWMPTVNEYYQAQDIPTHPALICIANSEQVFGKWSRRLITMVKLEQEVGTEDQVKSNPEAAHAGFRDKYFKRFN